MVNKKTQKESHRNKLLRSLCVIFVTALLLTACVGCTSHATADEVDVLKARLNTALWEINSLKDSNQAAQQEINALKNSNQSAQQEIDTLKSSNQAAQQEIDALKSSNQTAQQEIDALKSQYEAAQQEIESLKKQLEDLQNSITPEDPTDPVEPTEKIKIYIDQGHNPTSNHNTGASGNGLHEQDLTFEIGMLLAQLLQSDGRFEIALSRPTADTVLGTDNPSSLEARVQGAKDFGADYFISLHVNSFESESANGIEVWVTEQEGTTYDFGNSLLQGMLDATGLRNRGMQLTDKLYVLVNATMPAALLEMGFISNTTDAALLAESPELFAQGIYNGILAYFDLTAPNASAN